MIKDLTQDGIIQLYIPQKSNLSDEQTPLNDKLGISTLENITHKFLSASLCKTITQNLKEIISLVNKLKDKKGVSPYPYLSKDFRFLHMLELLSSMSSIETKKKLFEEKYKWKLDNMITWFALINGSIVFHKSIFTQFGLNPFKISIAGRNLIHTLCSTNSHIALKNIVKSLENIPKRLINKGTLEELNTPAHICLIYDSYECFKLLLNIDETDLNIPNARGWTAWDLLVRKFPYKFDKILVYSKKDIIKNLFNYFKSNILFAYKTQSLVSKYMKSDVRWDIMTLADILVNNPLEDESSVDFEDLESIRSNFRRMHKKTLEQSSSLENYIENLEKEITIHPKSSTRELLYENHCYMSLIELANEKDLQSIITSNLQKEFNSKDLICIEVYSNHDQYEDTLIYSLLRKIKQRYQGDGGGIGIDVIKQENNRLAKEYNCLFKFVFKIYYLIQIWNCFSKASKDELKIVDKSEKEFFSKYKYYFTISFSDDLLVKFAKKMKLTAYNMKSRHYTKFSDFVREEGLEPLRETQKQKIVMKILNQEFDIKKYKEELLINDYYMLHQYKNRRNLLDYWLKLNLFAIFENVLSNARFENTTSLSLLAFYHGVQHGFYIGFLKYYTNCLFFLSFFMLILWLLKSRTELGDSVIPVMTFMIPVWSTLFLSLWNRRQKELAYIFGTHREEQEIQQRKEYKGKPVIRKVYRKVEKESGSYYSNTKVHWVSLLNFYFLVLDSHYDRNLFCRDQFHVPGFSQRQIFG